MPVAWQMRKPGSVQGSNEISEIANVLGSGPFLSDQMKWCYRKSRLMFRVLERRQTAKYVKVAQICGVCGGSSNALAGSQRAAFFRLWFLRRRKRVYYEKAKTSRP